MTAATTLGCCWGVNTEELPLGLPAGRDDPDYAWANHRAVSG
jgi:hypothetical protein